VAIIQRLVVEKLHCRDYRTATLRMLVVAIAPPASFGQNPDLMEVRMADLSDRTKANMDVALEEACRSLPHGGDHTLRKKVAQKLLRSAQEGKTTLGDLTEVARAALAELTKRKSA
jgi:sirohydrochlorin ferrochelatase